MKKSKPNKFSELFQGGLSAASNRLTDAARKVRKIITRESPNSRTGEDSHDQAEAWKIQGRELYKLGRNILEERQKTFDSGINIAPHGYERRIGRALLTTPTKDLATEAMQDSGYEGSKAVSLCLSGERTRFWGEKGAAFCVHYLKNSEGKYDLYLRGFASKGSALIARINGHSFTKEQVETCEPVFLATESPEGYYKIVFALLEYESVYTEDGEHKYNKVLSVSEYLIGFQHGVFNATHVRNNRLPYYGNEIYTPLSITRVSGDDIVVVGRSIGDSRVPSINQGYFAWMFSSKTLELLKMRGDHMNSYLFSRVGSSAADFPERLLIWDDVKDHISLTYISTYIASEGSRLFNRYKAHSADFPAYSRSAVGSLMRSPSKCFIETPRCNIDAMGISLSEEHIEYIQGIAMNGARYIVYIVRPEDARVSKLCVAAFKRGVYDVLQYVVRIKFSVSSFNVKAVDDDHLGVMIVEKGSARLHMYDIELSQLHTASNYGINAVTVDITDVTTEDFINIASKGTKIMSKNMHKVGSDSSVVTVVRGQMVGIPVSRKSKIVSRVAEYVLFKEASSTTKAQYSVGSTSLGRHEDGAVMALPTGKAMTRPVVLVDNSSVNGEFIRVTTNAMIVSTRSMKDEANVEATTDAVVSIADLKNIRKACKPGVVGCIGADSDAGVSIEAPQEQVFTKSPISSSSVNIRGVVETTAVLRRVKHNSEISPVISDGRAPTAGLLRSPATQQSTGAANLKNNLSHEASDKLRRQTRSNVSVTTLRPYYDAHGTAAPTPAPIANGTIAPIEPIYKTDIASSALAAGSIAILGLATLLFAACLLYVRWRTGRFVQTRGMYRHLHDEINSRRNRGDSARSFDMDMGERSFRPRSTFCGIGGATAGLGCVTTNEL